MSSVDLRIVVDMFKEYIIQISGNKSFRFKNSDTRVTLIKGFVKKFNAIYDSDFLSESLLRVYMDYQFNFWYKHDSKYGKGTSIQIEWIIGDKALERWNSRTDKQKSKTDYIIRKRFKKEVVIPESKKVKKKISTEMRELLISLKPYEERDKEKFHNTSKGFAYCQVSTTLYNHKSEFCMGCNYSKDCKELLRFNFEKVFKLRGYGTTKV